MWKKEVMGDIYIYMWRYYCSILLQAQSNPQVCKAKNQTRNFIYVGQMCESLICLVRIIQAGAELMDTFWCMIICLIAGEHWSETHQCYDHRMQFYYLWWITSWSWPPWWRVHCLRQSTKLPKTACNKFCLIDESSFIFNCTFQVLCSTGASSVYSFFQISAQKEYCYCHVHWTCWPQCVSKT
jgi:hypothetical protein